ncbi:MAG: cellulase family glycosylhydrolase [Methanothrix sp.]|nr:cellulase family glycosylhydrolase [Methanothrix sp.]
MRFGTAIRETDPGLRLELDGFYDREGRRMCFRGVNIAGNAKFPPFIPFQESCWWDLLASWGFNMVRLTIFWEAIEPEPDTYDLCYLAKVLEMVDQASQRGIYILLDMHQDLYSRTLCGDGAPAWAMPKDVDTESNDSFGGQFWGAAYILSRDVRASFTHFFNSADLKEHYKNAWLEVVKSVGDNPFILGYDIMNEPSCGNIPNDCGQFENRFLKSFYQEVISAIRELQPSAVCFVEPHVLDMYTSKLTPFQADRLVYAPHLYNPLSITLRFNPIPEDLLFQALLARHQEKARALRMPLFIGEFGAPWTMQPFYARDMAVNNALENLEENLIDCVYWDFSVKDVDAWNGEDFSLLDREGRARGLKVNVRPSITRLRGCCAFQHFDPATKKYTARFKSEPGNPPTVIRIPKLQYPDGFRVCLSDGWAEFLEDTGELLFYPSWEGRHQILVTTPANELAGYSPAFVLKPVPSRSP